MSTLKKLRGKYLLVMIAMCGLVASTLGIMTNVAGIFFTPMAEELGKETAAVNLTLTICNIAYAIAGIFSAKWVKPKNFRVFIIGGTIVFAGSTALLSVCSSMAPLYMLNAVRGFASGLIGNVLVTSVIGRWFLTDTGFISSIALGCSGLIGAAFNPILEAVIQSAGWRTAYLVAAGTIVVLNLPAMIAPISFRSEDSGLEPVGKKAAGPAEMPAAEAKRAGTFAVGVMLIAICTASLASFVCATPQLFKPLAITYGLRETGIVMMSVVLVVTIPVSHRDKP